MTYASSKKPGVDVPESRADPESGTVEPLGRSNSFTLKAKTSVHWQDLSVAIKKKRMGVLDDPAAQPRTILQPTTGMLESGDVLAVMGPSGSGKTTLLDAVSGRTRKDKVRGTVFFNGRADIPFAQRNRLLSYVAQEDSLLGVFTVAESLRFAVRFYHGYASVDTEELEAEDRKSVV